jgi:opacity protein-like surface antigen
MKHAKFAALCGAAVLSAYSTANAQDWMGIARSVYVEGRVGIPFPSDADATTTGFAPASGTTETEFNSGHAWSGAVGVRVIPNVRIDFEYSQLRAYDAETTYTSGFPGAGLTGTTGPVDGDVEVHTYMFNAYYDFAPFSFLPEVVPIVGLGVGRSSIRVDNLTGPGFVFRTEDRDTVWSGAFHLGAAYQIARQFALTARYSLGITGGADFTGTDTAGLGRPMNVSTDSQITHVLSFGLRFNFN